MQFKAVIIIALVALALAEEKKVAENTKKDKRGLYSLGYGSSDNSWAYGNGGSDSGLGLGAYSTYSALPSYSSGLSTLLTKEYIPHVVEKHVAVPVKVPYAVPVDRPYPVHVPKPYPVEVTKHIAVPVDRPYPVPYAVKVAEPYPVHVVKHVAVPVSQPIIVEKSRSAYEDGWNSAYSSW